MARDNAAILRRRNEIAQEHGFSSYGQARQWRTKVRKAFADSKVVLPRNLRGANMEILDIQARTAMLAARGPTGYTPDDIHNPVVEWLADHPEWMPSGAYYLDGELMDAQGTELPWKVIRGYYPRRRG